MLSVRLCTCLHCGGALFARVLVLFTVSLTLVKPSFVRLMWPRKQQPRHAIAVKQSPCVVNTNRSSTTAMLNPCHECATAKNVRVMRLLPRYCSRMFSKERLQYILTSAGGSGRRSGCRPRQ